MFKKILFFVIAAFVTIGLNIPTFASAAEVTNNLQTNNEYSYKYMHVDNTSNVPLTLEQIKELYDSAQKTDTKNGNLTGYKSGTAGPLGNDPGSSYVQVGLI